MFITIFVNLMISGITWVILKDIYDEEANQSSSATAKAYVAIALGSIFWPLTIVAFICALIVIRIVSKMRKKTRTIIHRLTANMPLELLGTEAQYAFVADEIKRLSVKDIKHLLASDQLEIDGLPFNDKGKDDKFKKIIYDEIAERALFD